MAVSIKSILRGEPWRRDEADSFDHWVVYHFLWTTQNRRPVLAGQAARTCGEEIDVCCREFGWDVIFLQIRPDHVRVSVRASPEESAAEVARRLKARTGQAIRDLCVYERRPASIWQKDFYVSTTAIADSRASDYLGLH